MVALIGEQEVPATRWEWNPDYWILLLHRYRRYLEPKVAPFSSMLEVPKLPRTDLKSCPSEGTVLFSGYSDVVRPVDGKAHLIRKPVTPDSLLLQLRRIIDGSEHNRAGRLRFRIHFFSLAHLLTAVPIPPAGFVLVPQSCRSYRSAAMRRILPK